MKYQLPSILLGLIATYTMNAQATVQCPEFNNAQEIQKLLKALNAAPMDKTNTRRVFKMDSKLWFMPPEDWEKITQKNATKRQGYATNQITLIKDKTEVLPDRLRCVYNAKRYNPYTETALDETPRKYVIQEFRFTYLFPQKQPIQTTPAK